MSYFHITMSATGRNPLGSICPLDMDICVGFGEAVIKKDDEVFYDGEASEERRTLAEFEAIALTQPGHWVLRLDAPLWNAIWERQDINKWVCIETGDGFA